MDEEHAAHLEREALLARQRQAGSSLFNRLMALYVMKKITAKDLCILCNDCAHAGVLGADFRQYAKAPGGQSGSYQKKLDTLLDSGPLAHVTVPAMAAHVEERTTRTVPVAAVWEQIAADVRENPGILTENGRSIWPPIFYRHKIVRDAQAKGQPLPLALALYIDGVVYSDGAAGRIYTVTGMWLCVLATKKRYYIGGGRSQDACRCGCRGWCSAYPMLLFAFHLLKSLAEGKRLPHQYDNTEYAPSHPLVNLMQLAGEDLGFRGALLHLKLDWSEASHSGGLPAVTSYHNPCCFCGCTAGNMHEHYTDGSPSVHPWPGKHGEQYNSWCLACEIMVIIRSEADRQCILEQLVYLKGSRPTYRGRTIRCSVPRLDLLAGDRLEPFEGMTDIGEFDSRGVPFQALFWRTHLDEHGRISDAVIHRCPLLDEEIGTSTDSIVVDTLHSLYGGPAMRLSSATLWRILMQNCFGIPGRQEIKIELGVRHLRGMLFEFQEKHKIPHNERIRDLTPKMLGPQQGAAEGMDECHGGANLKLKSAECGLMLLFCSELLSVYADKLRFGDDLLLAVQSLIAYMDLLRSCPAVMDTSQRHRAFDLMQSMLFFSKEAAIILSPKFHFCYEMTRRTVGDAKKQIPSVGVSSDSFEAMFSFSCSVCWFESHSVEAMFSFHAPSVGLNRIRLTQRSVCHAKMET